MIYEKDLLLKPKLQIGQTAYYIYADTGENKGKCIETKVYGIFAKHDIKGNFQHYIYFLEKSDETKYNFRWVEEERVFGTKEELLKSL